MAENPAAISKTTKLGGSTTAAAGMSAVQSPQLAQTAQSSRPSPLAPSGTDDARLPLCRVLMMQAGCLTLAHVVHTTWHLVALMFRSRQP